MTKIPIVFTFDKRIILGAAVTIKSLIDLAKADTLYDIYVYHPDIPEKTISEFEKMLEGTRHSITFEFVDKKRFKDAPISKGGSWTEIVYYRLLIPELLAQYDKVIYSDVDVLIKEDLSDLYNISLENNDFAAVRAERNTSHAIGHKYFPENKNEYIYWSGLLVLNSLKMRQDNFIQKCFDVVREFNSRLKFFDLDTINLASNRIKDIPFKYVTLETIYALDKLEDAPEYVFLNKVYSNKELLEAKSSPAIVHYAGKLGKPWHRKSPPKEYQKYIDRIPNTLRKITFRDWRKKLFSKK